MGRTNTHNAYTDLGFRVLSQVRVGSEYIPIKNQMEILSNAFLLGKRSPEPAELQAFDPEA